MNRQRISNVFKNTFVQVLLLTVAVILVLRVVLIPSIAQSTSERELDDQVPKHLPITIGIKADKEKAFKELKNEHWMGDLEIEVKNTGNKPIYLLVLGFVLPEVTMPDGNKYGFSLHYGRAESGDPMSLAKPDDVPIKPGETHIFRIPKHTVRNWEDFSRREKITPPAKVDILFQLINFGDGTGFIGTTGGVFDKNKRGRRP